MIKGDIERKILEMEMEAFNYESKGYVDISEIPILRKIQKKEQSCLVCRRIETKTIFRYLHLLLDDRADKIMIHNIALKIISIINKLDYKNRVFFCGKTERSILSGIIYLIANYFGKNSKPHFRLTQFQIFRSGLCSEVTIRKSYRKWLKMKQYVKEIPDLEDCF